MLLADAWPGPGSPQSPGPCVQCPSRARKGFLHRDLRRAQPHMEGISNPQEPLLLAEKFPFFICSGNTDWAPHCARPVQGAKLDDEHKDLCAACRALAQMLGYHGQAPPHPPPQPTGSAQAQGEHGQRIYYVTRGQDEPAAGKKRAGQGAQRTTGGSQERLL